MVVKQSRKTSWIERSINECRREDGAYKKVHLQTVEYSVKAIGAGIDTHFYLCARCFLFCFIQNISRIHFF